MAMLAISSSVMLGLVTGGCGTSKPGAGAGREAVEMPEHAKPAPELAGLSFLVGSWVSVNPNKTVNEEVWTPARGNSMAALFRQVRRDGKPALHEVSLVSVEPEGVMLRLRHLHGALEVPEKQSEVSIFRLVSAGNGRCEFAGTGVGESKDIESVVYRADGPDALVMEVTFVPGGKEKGYSVRYTRE